MQSSYVRRGGRVTVGTDTYVVQRYGFEDVRQRYVTEDPGEGPVRIFSAVEFNQIGVRIAGATNFGGRVIVPPLSGNFGPLNDSRSRILDISVFRAGVTVNTSNLTEFALSLIRGGLELIPFPTWGSVEMPIMEPARPDPGHFIQYFFYRARSANSGNTGNIESGREFALTHHSIKVTFLGYR